MAKDIIVSTYFEIDEDEIYTLSRNSEYWETASEFYTEVKDKKIGELSARQIKWLQKIEKALGT